MFPKLQIWELTSYNQKRKLPKASLFFHVLVQEIKARAIHMLPLLVNGSNIN